MRIRFCLLLVLTGCPVARITPDVPDSGQCNASPCGTSVAVKTKLAPGTTLTDAECASVCASAWCGGQPIGGLPGCTLVSPTSVSCGSIAYDCGYCVFGCGSNPSSCGDGCCEFASNCCRAVARSCRGLSCGACPAADPRCSLEACRSFKACGGQLPAEPRPGVCGDGGVELATYCPEACNTMAAGAFIEAACSSDGGPVWPLDAGLTNQDGGTCDCEPTRESCELACPQSSATSCLDCAANCAIDFARCMTRCR